MKRVRCSGPFQEAVYRMESVPLLPSLFMDPSARTRSFAPSSGTFTPRTARLEPSWSGCASESPWAGAKGGGRRHRAAHAAPAVTTGLIDHSGASSPKK